MKSALLAGAALAAIATSASAQTMVAQPLTRDWTGIYAGVYVGGSFSDGRSKETVLFDRNLDGVFGDTVTTAAGANAFAPGFCGGSATGPTPFSGCTGDKDSFTYGLQGGYDWQKPGTPYVIGVVGSFGGSNTSDAVTAFSTTPAYYTLQRKAQYEATFGVRAGRTFYGNRTLVYATGGGAYANIRNTFSTSNTANAFTKTGDEDAFGYFVGAGVEHRLNDKLSIGVSYHYSSVDADSYRVRAGNSGTTPATNPFLLGNAGGTDFKRSESSFATQNIRASVNYRY